VALLSDRASPRVLVGASAVSIIVIVGWLVGTAEDSCRIRPVSKMLLPALIRISSLSACREP
jgi:hypothetical protein